MNARNASISLLVVSACVVVLLLTDTIGSIAAVSIFAVSLAVFGVLSKGFRREQS